ncbi:MAG: hypothetical protein ACK5OS_13080 [Chryseotalea sp.]|jgi:hypothetical protein
MKNQSAFFKPFPAYEEVFYDDIDNHKKHFLPICSVNLKFLFPERDEWIHFISVKEIYDGCVGENTSDWHTRYTKQDMIGFDIIDGKYKFDTSWDYFIINSDNENYNEWVEEIEEAYEENQISFDVGKEYYKKHGAIYNLNLNKDNISIEKLEKSHAEYPNSKKEYPEYFGFIEDIKHQSLSIKKLLEEGIRMKSVESFEDVNLPEIPKDSKRKKFEYIGYLSGNKFQKYGADNLYLFQSEDKKRAVMCFVYT